MKRIFMILITGAVLSACTDKKAEEKTILDNIMAVHDKVMGADEQLMKNKMLLDSAVSHNSTADIKDSVYMYLAKVNLADSVMGNWMHKFDPDHTGKSHDETISYLNDQKKQIIQIDSQLKVTVDQSNKYLSKIKMK